ncbi:MAG: methionine gamma-lyase family protein, partial [Firmicutes bacterium]|nr:methionine gamma-lyase family protein [Bacillota bacterium]
MYKELGIEDSFLKEVEDAENELKDQFAELESICEFWSIRILDAFRKARVSEYSFFSSSGYGYNDEGRFHLEEVYSKVFGTESALVRPQMVSGTHAITLGLRGVLKPGDRVLIATGLPYDTMQTVMGLSGNSPSALKNYQINFDVLPLIEDDTIDLNLLKEKLHFPTKMVYFQRSRGYSDRHTFSNSELEQAMEVVHQNSDAICYVDNCYGEFVSRKEPTFYGADLVAGSLIKNPGGGLAQSGGYLVGQADLVELAAEALTAPGLGSEVGATFNQTKLVLQGLYQAPIMVLQATKSAVLFSKVLRKRGYWVSPLPHEARFDTVQLIGFNTKNELINFCRAIQYCSPIDSFVTPEPGPMPGYEHEVIMAAGTFVQGATSELSADAPLKQPYRAYLQGSLNYFQSKLA